MTTVGGSPLLEWLAASVAVGAVVAVCGYLVTAFDRGGANPAVRGSTEGPSRGIGGAADAPGGTLLKEARVARPIKIDGKRDGYVFRLTPDALEIVEGLRVKAQVTGVLRSVSQIVGQEALELATYMRLEGRPVEPKQRVHLSLSPAEGRAIQQLADNWGIDASAALEVVLRLRGGALTNTYNGPYRLQRRGTEEA